MEILGHISFKEIRYCNIRTTPNWFHQLPAGKWVAFTIATTEDNELINEVVNKCLDKAASCICCAGQLASITEESFMEEILLRTIQKEQYLKKRNGNENDPALTFHKNFSEGFWFATSITNAYISNEYSDIDKVICIDMTKKSVKKCLRALIGKFNSGELPSDFETEEPEYDSDAA